MDLEAYFKRIGYAGPARADLETLTGVHRAHALSIAYENLDVQLGRRLNRSAQDAFDKIVGRRRGGWCYEMNGLLSAALEELGFRIKRLAGAVMRDQRGDDVIGNHLVIIVDLPEGDFLADVGFGDGPMEPVPLMAGPFRNGPLNCNLMQGADGWWRYTNDPRTGGLSFDFNLEVFGEDALERMCGFLQTSPMSPFVQNAVVQRWFEAAHYSLRGRVLRVLDADGERKSVIDSADAYVETLLRLFGLSVPQARSLWPAIVARHEDLFAGKNPLG